MPSSDARNPGFWDKINVAIVLSFTFIGWGFMIWRKYMESKKSAGNDALAGLERLGKVMVPSFAAGAIPGFVIGLIMALMLFLARTAMRSQQLSDMHMRRIAAPSAASDTGNL